MEEYFAHPLQVDGGGVWETDIGNHLDYVAECL